MAFCRNCGQSIDDNAVVCVHCGTAVSNTPATDPDDASSVGFAILGFFFPLIGLILYLVWKGNKPKRAKSCGKGALIGFIVGIVLSILISVLSVILASSVVFTY